MTPQQPDANGSTREWPKVGIDQTDATGAPLSVQSFGMTDTGNVRSNNEDQFLIASLVKARHVRQTSLPIQEFQQSHDRGHLFIVADRIAGGETASALAIESVEQFVLETLEWIDQADTSNQASPY